MMNFIKTHKKLCLIILIVIIFLLLLLILVKTLSVDSSKSEYGDRLKGINKVKISEKATDKLKSEMKDLEEVSNISYRLQGRLVYIEVIFNDGIPVDRAKELSNKVLDYFDDDEKAFYDFQISVMNANEESEGYPAFGYKHKSRDAIVW